MFRSVYTKTLWERRSSLLWWLVATLLLGAWLVAFYPALRDSEQLRTGEGQGDALPWLLRRLRRRELLPRPHAPRRRQCVAQLPDHKPRGVCLALRPLPGSPLALHLVAQGRHLVA